MRKIFFVGLLLSSLMTRALAVADNPSPDRAKGVLVKLEVNARRITLKTDDGLRTFQLTPRTYIFRGKEKLSADKLLLGEEIKLTYYTNDLGQTIVRRIKVAPTEPN
jgi:Cu/Ag efflux protein CusF